MPPPTLMHQPTPRLAVLTLPCVDAPEDASCTRGAAHILTGPPRCCCAHGSRPLRHTAAHDQAADEDLHGVAVLVQRRRPYLEQPLVRMRLRRPHLEDFAL